MTEGFELKLISDSAKITDFEGFKASVYADSEEFPTPRESIEEIYLIDWTEPSYIKFADMAEEVLSNDYYKLTRAQLHSYQDYSLGTKVIKAFSQIDCLYNVYLRLLTNEKLQWKFLQRQRKIRQKPYDDERNDAHELTSEKEIKEIN